MRVVDGGNFSYPRGLKYPIPVTEDTEFRCTNFHQEFPHTAGVFDISPGVSVRFVNCNLINVKVPDGVYIEGGNLAHLVPTLTNNPQKPVVNLLHECEKCASAQQELSEAIQNGTLLKAASGFVRHDQMKARYAARRLVKAFEDQAEISASNADALAKWRK